MNEPRTREIYPQKPRKSYHPFVRNGCHITLAGASTEATGTAFNAESRGTGLLFQGILLLELPTGGSRAGGPSAAGS